MSIKDKCEHYLKAKYYYYIIAKPIMSDFEFDKLEKELKDSNDELALKITEIVDFPSTEVIQQLGFNVDKIAPEIKVKRDEVKYNHPYPMLSLEKIQVNDENSFPKNDVDLFLNRTKTELVEGSPKYDGNSIELTYKDRRLFNALTRGSDTKTGLDKTNKLKLLVPNTINLDGEIVVRGEIIMETELWRNKYYNPKEVSNPRNFIAGKIGTEDFNITIINDMTYVAYSLVRIVNGKETYVGDTMTLLEENGFNKKHKPLILKFKPTYEEFKKAYFKFKEFKETCEFELDGWVIKYPEQLRSKMGATGHHPKHSVAIKFPSVDCITTINDIVWEIGKYGDLTPIAMLEPVELLGTMVRKCSLHNLGYIVNNNCYPGSVISIKKSGEIIPQVVAIIKESPNSAEYIKQYEDFLDEQE